VAEFRTDGAYWILHARYRPRPVALRVPSLATRSCAARGDPEFLRDHSGRDDGAGQHVVAKQCQQPGGRAATFQFARGGPQVVALEAGLGGGRHRAELDCEPPPSRRAGSEKISQPCKFNDVRGR
jgi:hypothetical protein